MTQRSQAGSQLPSPAAEAVRRGNGRGAPVAESTLLEAPKQPSPKAVAWKPIEPGPGEDGDDAEAGVSGKDGGDTVTVQATPDGDQCVGLVELHRFPIKGVSQMMGKCWRNPVTGEIILRPEQTIFPDFSVVDLYRRPSLPTSLTELKGDPYIFKPVVMAYRTWIYHEAMRSPTHDSHDYSGGDSMVKKALSAFCIDVDMRGGRSSSIRCFAPLFMAAGLTGDELLTIAAVCMTAAVAALSYASNTAVFSIYRLERALTLPVRLFFFIYLCIRFHTRDVLAIFGFAACFLAFVVDAYFGDFQSFLAYRWHCSYEVVKELPNRVYICKRVGAAEMAMDMKGKYVDEAVAGFATWEPTNVLIADIGGLLVELVPMQPEDWKAAQAEYFRRVKLAIKRGRKVADRESESVPYVGLDLFGPLGGQGIDFMDEGDIRLPQQQQEKLFAEGRPLKAGQLTVEDM